MSVKSLPITRPKSALDGRRDSCPTCQNLPTTPKLGRKTPLDDTLINTINYARRRSGAEQWLKRSGVQRSNSSISHRFCFPCLAKYRKPVTDAPIQLKLRYMFSCPPHGKVAFWMTLGLQAVLLWGTLWAILGGDLLPGGNIFSIVVLVIVCTFLGLLLEFMRLPRLLGVLLGGILLRNIPGIYIVEHIDRDWSFAIRKIAVVVVLIRAGIGSDPRALVLRKWMILRLTLFPALVEAVAVALATHYLLHFPWIWSFIHGFVIAPMSAAAAIPFMLQFQSAGLGVTKGIPTTIKFGACFDNVLAISIFSVLLDIAFDNDQANLSYIILMKGPVQLIVGLAVGVVCGLILWYLPHKNSKRKVLYRTTFLFGLCLLGAFATGTASLSSAGPLGVICTALVARIKWRLQGWTGVNDPIPPIFAHIWKICQILLAGLIGCLLDVKDLNWEVVGIVVATIAIGMAFRLFTAYIVVQFTDLNVRERLFVMISWIPKATVQAAIGSLALDRAQSSHSPAEVERRGEIILMSAIFAILLTAPLGALLIANSGDKLLSKAEHHEHATEDELENAGYDNLGFNWDKFSRLKEPRGSCSTLLGSSPGSVAESGVGDSPKPAHRSTSNSETVSDTGIESLSTTNGSSGSEDNKPITVFHISSETPPSSKKQMTAQLEEEMTTHL